MTTSQRAAPGLARVVWTHVVLVLAFFWPGGLLWNRVEPSVLGLPFSVFAEAILLPLLIFLNTAVYVARRWRRDAALMAELRAGKAITDAERLAA
jgi:hypothetical protein